MDDPEKMATYDTRRKQTKQKHNIVSVKQMTKMEVTF